jgi:hypothetical protein
MALLALLAVSGGCRAGLSPSHLAPHLLTKGGGACVSASGCQLNGICTPEGVCQCDHGWTGALCATLHLLPTLPTPHAGRAYPSVPDTSSWGGNVLEIGGKFHLFVSEMAAHCQCAVPSSL